MLALARVCFHVLMYVYMYVSVCAFADISVDLPVSVTTLYFAILVGIFMTAGAVHPRESYCLMHGIWYLLCLPSGYLVLIIYSICNITDSSWGRSSPHISHSIPHHQSVCAE